MGWTSWSWRMPLIVAILTLAACSTPTVTKTLYVAPRQVACVDFGPRRCLLIRQTPDDPWSMYYGPIKGFEYEKGYEYELQVKETRMEGVPADMSAVTYTLVKIVRKTTAVERPEASPAEALLEKEWVLQSLGPTGSRTAVASDLSITITFTTDGTVHGFGGCNRYRGPYDVSNDTTLRTGPLAATRRICPGPVMNYEGQFLAALNALSAYVIQGDTLLLFYDHGRGVLTFTSKWVDVDTGVSTEPRLLRGHVVWGREVMTFTLCGSDTTLGVVDRTGGELSKVHRALRAEPYRPLYVVVRAYPGPTPPDGYGPEYAGRLTIVQLVYAAAETPGCLENLHDFEFQAMGNEPFSNVIISREEIVFSELGAVEKLTFPYVRPIVSPERCTYTTVTEKHKIDILLEDGRCLDNMAGAYFSHRATVTLDGRTFTGCAREGWGTTTFPDERYVGTYQAQLRAADSPGRIITLTLNDDHTARMTHDYMNNKPVISQTGSWSANYDGTITLIFTMQSCRSVREEMTFEFQGPTLVATDYDKDRWGKGGLRLKRRP